MTVPTAEEFMSNVGTTISPVSGLETYLRADFKDGLIKFARLHVKAALEAAADKSTVTPIDHEEISEGSFRPIWGVDDNSILNAYPDERIQ